MLAFLLVLFISSLTTEHVFCSPRALKNPENVPTSSSLFLREHVSIPGSKRNEPYPVLITFLIFSSYPLFTEVCLESLFQRSSSRRLPQELRR